MVSRSKKVVRQAFEKEHGGKIVWCGLAGDYDHLAWVENCLDGIDYGKWVYCGRIMESSKTCFEGV